MNNEIKLPENELEMLELLERIADHLEKNDWCHLINWDHEIDELEKKVSDRDELIDLYKGLVNRIEAIIQKHKANE